MTREFPHAGHHWRFDYGPSGLLETVAVETPEGWTVLPLERGYVTGEPFVDHAGRRYPIAVLRNAAGDTMP